MRIFKNKWFLRFERKEGIADAILCEAVRKACAGLIDADLGGGVIKQRLPRPGEGESGGFRSIILFRLGDKAFFVYGFAKKQAANINRDELRAFRKLAGDMLALRDEDIEVLTRTGTLMEITADVETEELSK